MQNLTYKHQTQIFEDRADQISPLFKKTTKKTRTAGHAGILKFHLIYRYQIKKNDDDNGTADDDDDGDHDIDF